MVDTLSGVLTYLRMDGTCKIVLMYTKDVARDLKN